MHRSCVNLLSIALKKKMKIETQPGGELNPDHCDDRKETLCPIEIIWPTRNEEANYNFVTDLGMVNKGK